MTTAIHTAETKPQIIEARLLIGRIIEQIAAQTYGRDVVQRTKKQSSLAEISDKAERQAALLRQLGAELRAYALEGKGSRAFPALIISITMLQGNPLEPYGFGLEPMQIANLLCGHPEDSNPKDTHAFIQVASANGSTLY